MSNKKNQQELKAILTKYINSQASLEEQEAVNSWYQSLGVGDEQDPALNDAVLKDKLKQSIQLYLRRKITGSNHWLRPHYLKYAAACLLLITAGIVIYSRVTALRESAKKEIVLFTGRGEHKQLHLADGSEVLLNVGSKLVISKDFGDKRRDVTLIGEAFFKVAKNPDKPFFIHSGNLETRVVGTSFNINAYPDLEKIKVAVLTGKVKVSGMVNGHNKILAQGMTKGATLSFYKATGNTELKIEDTELLTAWSSNKLYIDNATISDIARQLQRYYNIKVVNTVAANLKDRYTISFGKESMKVVLQTLSVLTRRKFVYADNQITIK
ncbi:FecR family protein [Mucilaginibacter paludis]|nr:FecR family protein [Mucilaginibacter paludis]